MIFNILTIFPNILDSYFNESILARAQKKGLINIKTHDLRKWSGNKHKTVDDTPYGGGAGMLLKAEPIISAITEIKSSLLSDMAKNPNFSKNVLSSQPKRSVVEISANTINCDNISLGSVCLPATTERMQGEPVGKAWDDNKKRVNFKKTKVVLLSAKGKTWTQKKAKQYSKLDNIIFVCGRYEGVDERVIKFIDEEISIGNYVLTGGELGAGIMIDSIARYIPGVLGNSASFADESHSAEGVLEYPHYTKPESFEWQGKKYKVPKILLSGNHAEIEKWRESKRKFKK